MPPSVLLLRLVLAFLIGGGWVTFVTWVADRFGGQLGGFFGGLPSTTAFAFFFIGWIQSTSATVDATNSFPLFMATTGAFALVYAFFAKWGFVSGIIAALSFWFLAALAVTITAPSFYVSLPGCAVVAAATYFGLRRLRLRSPEPRHVGYSPWLRVLRFLISGGVVVFAVLASDFGGPIFGAAFSAFPAVFTSTFYTVSRSQGTEFSRGMSTSLMLSAILTVVPYSIIVRYLYPVVGIWYGTLAAYGGAIAIAVIYYMYGRAWLLRTASG
jgi:hypothetical protein